MMTSCMYRNMNMTYECYLFKPLAFMLYPQQQVRRTLVRSELDDGAPTAPQPNPDCPTDVF